MEDKKEKIFQFKVIMQLGRPLGLVYREMALKGESSLHEFAKTITGAFNFQLDHAFGFYSNLKDRYESAEAYTSFRDDGAVIQRREKSAKRSYIHEVFEAGKKMLFVFDFGEDWTFIVECRKITAAEVGKDYPVVTKKKGEPPTQYPSDVECSDEDSIDEDEC